MADKPPPGKGSGPGPAGGAPPAAGPAAAAAAAPPAPAQSATPPAASAGLQPVQPSMQQMLSMLAGRSELRGRCACCVAPRLHAFLPRAIPPPLPGPHASCFKQPTGAAPLPVCSHAAGISPQMQQLLRDFKPPPLPPELAEAFRKM